MPGGFAFAQLSPLQARLSLPLAALNEGVGMCQSQEGIEDFTIKCTDLDDSQFSIFEELYKKLQELKRQEHPPVGKKYPPEHEVEKLDHEIDELVKRFQNSNELELIIERMEDAEYYFQDLGRDEEGITITFTILAAPFGSYQPIVDLVEACGMRIISDTYKDWVERGS